MLSFCERIQHYPKWVCTACGESANEDSVEDSILDIAQSLLKEYAAQEIVRPDYHEELQTAETVTGFATERAPLDFSQLPEPEPGIPMYVPSPNLNFEARLAWSNLG